MCDPVTALIAADVALNLGGSVVQAKEREAAMARQMEALRQARARQAAFEQQAAEQVRRMVEGFRPELHQQQVAQATAGEADALRRALAQARERYGGPVGGPTVAGDVSPAYWEARQRAAAAQQARASDLLGALATLRGASLGRMREGYGLSDQAQQLGLIGRAAERQYQIDTAGLPALGTPDTDRMLLGEALKTAGNALGTRAAARTKAAKRSKLGG